MSSIGLTPKFPSFLLNLVYIIDNVGLRDLYFDSISCHVISVSLSDVIVNIIGVFSLSLFLSLFSFSRFLFLFNNLFSSKGGNGLFPFRRIFVLSIFVSIFSLSFIDSKI